MSARGRNQNFLLAMTGAAAAVAAYGLVIRPWMLSWGATLAEINSLLPGDELILEPKINATHAITIHALPREVWPWLLQLGQDRGGFYSYNRIKNLLGLNIHNADRILPEYQSLEGGERIPLAPNDITVSVVILEPEQAIVLHGDPRHAGAKTPAETKPDDYLTVSWGFYLLDRQDGSTRLIERWKADWNPSLANTIFYNLLLEPGAFLMERKMLLTIKQRAERTSLAHHPT